MEGGIFKQRNRESSLCVTGLPTHIPRASSCSTPATAPVLWDRQLFTRSCYFLCGNSTCEMNIGTNVYVWHLSEKWLYKYERRTLRCKFQDVTPPHTEIISRIVNKQRHTLSSQTIKIESKRRVLIEEKLDEIGARLQNSPRKPFTHLTGPTQLPIQWVPGALSLGVKRPEREADHSPPSSAEVKECVELYLHSPTRLHGMVLKGVLPNVFICRSRSPLG
jgi:hypothetical protein